MHTCIDRPAFDYNEVGKRPEYKCNRLIKGIKYLTDLQGILLL